MTIDPMVQGLLVRLVGAQDRLEDASAEIGLLIAAISARLQGRALPSTLQSDLEELLATT